MWGYLISNFPAFSAEHPQIALVRAWRQRDFVLIKHTAIHLHTIPFLPHAHIHYQQLCSCHRFNLCVHFSFFVFVLPLPLPHAQGSIVQHLGCNHIQARRKRIWFQFWLGICLMKRVLYKGVQASTTVVPSAIFLQQYKHFFWLYWAQSDALFQPWPKEKHNRNATAIISDLYCCTCNCIYLFPY